MDEQKTNEIVKTLSGGLIMRRSTRDDADRLAAFNARIHGEDPYDAAAVAAWTRDLLIHPLPTFGEGDYLIVEDPASGEIVSTLNLISQTWAYEGIPFGVGRPELVGTDPNYRGRGLVREMFSVLHEWSQQRGELVQVITGIPFFYRQFGYEMALNLGGGRIGYQPQVPVLAEGQQEPYIIRPAGEADLPWLVKMLQMDCERSMIWAVRDEALLRIEILEKSAENVNRFEFCIIETQDGQPVGCLAHPASVWNRMMALTMYNLMDGVSYLSVNPSVIRYLWRIGQGYAQARQRTLDAFGFWLLTDHPAFKASPNLLIKESKPYAFYVRVPDLPAFLRTIAPVLEHRLAQSACAGYSGELKLSFYRSGVRMVFEKGTLVTIDCWKPVVDESSAAFPNLTFLQLVFGYRSFAEVSYAYPDCSAKDEARVLIEALFPKKDSDIWPIS